MINNDFSKREYLIYKEDFIEGFILGFKEGYKEGFQEGSKEMKEKILKIMKENPNLPLPELITLIERIA